MKRTQIKILSQTKLVEERRDDSTKGNLLFHQPAVPDPMFLSSEWAWMCDTWFFMPFTCDMVGLLDGTTWGTEVSRSNLAKDQSQVYS